jgi:hypothetical protein
MGLADDFDVTKLKFLNCGIGIIDPDAQVMPSREIITVMEILICGSVGSPWTGQDLEAEAVVHRW